MGRTTAARAVLFDWDDTLCGAVPHRYDTIHGVLARFGHERSVREVHRAWVAADDPVVDRIASGFWDRLRRELGLDGHPEVMDALVAAFDRRDTVRRFEIFADAHPLLDRLVAGGWHLGIVSNNVQAGLRVSETGLDRYFSAIVTPIDTGGRGKPDPAIFHLALERLGAPTERAVYVGDTYEVDVLGARAAGLRALLVDRLGICGEVDCEILASLSEIARRLEE